MTWRFLRKKIWPAGAGENFFWRSDFQKKFSKKKNVVSQKSQNPARGSKSPSRGGGVDLNFRGGHKKSKQQGVYTP